MDKLKFILGTGLLSGLAPKAPGTAGSLAAIVILYLLSYTQNMLYLWAFFIFSCLVTLWAARFFEETYASDPPQMVSDEWAGQSLTFVYTPLFSGIEEPFLLLITGFLLFRFFDVLKPLGIMKLQKLKGGSGILADDLLSGLYALICLKTLIFTWPNLFGLN